MLRKMHIQAANSSSKMRYAENAAAALLAVPELTRARQAAHSVNKFCSQKHRAQMPNKGSMHGKSTEDPLLLLLHAVMQQTSAAAAAARRRAATAHQCD